MDIANLLKPKLADGSIRCIGSTTYKEYRGHFEKDPALVRRFQKIDLKEPTKEQARDIVEGLKAAMKNTIMSVIRRKRWMRQWLYQPNI